MVSEGDSQIKIIGQCGSPDGSEIVSYDASGSVAGSGGVTLSPRKVGML